MKGRFRTLWKDSKAIFQPVLQAWCARRVVSHTLRAISGGGATPSLDHQAAGVDQRVPKPPPSRSSPHLSSPLLRPSSSVSATITSDREQLLVFASSHHPLAARHLFLRVSHTCFSCYWPRAIDTGLGLGFAVYCHLLILEQPFAIQTEGPRSLGHASEYPFSYPSRTAIMVSRPHDTVRKDAPSNSTTHRRRVGASGLSFTSYKYQ